jgi:hypothetical protein
MNYEDPSLRRAAEMKATQDRAVAAETKKKADEEWRRAGAGHRARAAEMANRIIGVRTTPDMWTLSDVNAQDIGEFEPRMIWIASIVIEGVRVTLQSNIGVLLADHHDSLLTRADFVAVLARKQK